MVADNRPQKAGIYCRLSYAEDGTEEKVDRQEDDCRQLADRLSWPISSLHVWKDNNRSAWQRSRKRPGWDAMLAAIEASEIDGVIIYHGDRLIRQPWDLERLIGIADNKGLRIASPSGTRNLDSADDRYILRIEAAGFCRASDDASRRIKRDLKARRAAGMPRAGGTRAFGFERDNITIRKSEAAIAAELGSRILAGETNYRAMRWMNTVSTTTTGRMWRTNVIKGLLRRPRIAGLLDVDGELVKAPWDPIIPPEDWRLINAILDARSSAYYDAPRRQNLDEAEYAIRYLLSGIARCGTCDSTTYVQSQRTPKGKVQRRSYLCSNSGCRHRCSRAMDNLDAYVIGRVLAILNDPEFVEALYSGDDAAGIGQQVVELKKRKEIARQQLANLADLDAEIDAGLLALSLGSFDRKIRKLEDRRAATTRQRLLQRMAGCTLEQWQGEPLPVRRDTVAALFRIVILPATRKGSGFDPSSVRMTLIED